MPNRGCDFGCDRGVKTGVIFKKSNYRMLMYIRWVSSTNRFRVVCFFLGCVILSHRGVILRCDMCEYRCDF